MNIIMSTAQPISLLQVVLLDLQLGQVNLLCLTLGLIGSYSYHLYLYGLFIFTLEFIGTPQLGHETALSLISFLHSGQLKSAILHALQFDFEIH